MVTAVDVYKYVLEQLKHYNTTSITPAEFNIRIWNAELDYVRNRYWAWDQHQKSIDDLQHIRIVTDGVAGFPPPIPNVGPNVAGQEYIQMPGNYLHLLAVAVRAKYKNVPCETDGQLSKPIAATPLKDDEYHVVDDDYYKQPLAVWPRLYYSLRGDKMTFKAGDSIVQDVILNYLRYPQRIVFDEQNPAGGTPSEFTEEQTKEIVVILVTDYLEAIESARVQTKPFIEQQNFYQNPPTNQLT